MFEKIKLWMLTDENREKYLLEKEKKERNKKRGELEALPVKEKKKKKEKVKKEKKGKTPIQVEPIEPTAEPTTPPEPSPVKKKKVVKKVIKKPVAPTPKPAPTPTSELDEVQQQMAKIQEQREKKRLKREEELRREAELAALREETELESELPSDDTPKLETDEFIQEEDTPSFHIEDEPITETSSNPPNSSDTLTSMFEQEQAERKKKELVKKKAAEMERYELIMIELPPTNDVDKIIAYAVKAGVPDWFLREKGYIIDTPASDLSLNVPEEAYEETVSKVIEEEVSIDKFKKEIENATRTPVSIDHVKETVQEVLDEEIATISEELRTITSEEKNSADLLPIEDEEQETTSALSEEVLESETLSTTPTLESDSPNNAPSFVAPEAQETSPFEDEETPSPIEATETPADLLPASEVRSKKLADLRAQLKGLQNAKLKVDAEYQTRKQEEPLEPVEVESIEEASETVSDEAVETQLPETHSIEHSKHKALAEKMRLEMKEKAKEALQFSVVDAVKQMGDTTVLAERLNLLKTKREVLNIENNEVFVKETISNDQGEVSFQYKRYLLQDADVASITIGSFLAENIRLEAVESKLQIDGEDYEVSKEEEQAIMDEIAVREIWVLSEDTTMVDLASMNAKDSRYTIRQIVTEKDFLLAIRSVNNVIVFTQQLPSNLKTNIVQYLKYLEVEKKKARIITLSSSQVNSSIIEKTLETLSVEELDLYYNEHPADLYSMNNKDLISVYKEISFDISSQLDKDIVVEVGPIDESTSGDIDLNNTDFGTVFIDVADDSETDPLDNNTGDIELVLRDTIQITDEELY